MRAPTMLIAATVLLVGCSNDTSDSADDPATTLVTTTPSTAPSTVDDGADPQPLGNPCAALASGLAMAGIEPDPAALVPAGATGCAFSDGAGGNGIMLSVRSDVDTAAFEEALADPAFGDPVTVAGVGEMAAAASLGETERLLVYAGRRLLSFDAIGYSDEQLQAVARGTIDAL